MQKIILVCCCLSVASVGVQAQSRHFARRGLPFLKIADQKVLLEQSNSMFRAVEPLSKKVGEHAVNVFSSGKMVSIHLRLHTANVL